MHLVRSPTLPPSAFAALNYTQVGPPAPHTGCSADAGNGGVRCVPWFMQKKSYNVKGLKMQLESVYAGIGWVARS